MSLNARNMTQGGQVIKYMISMFLQITNIVAYWAFIAGIVAFFSYMLYAMKWVFFKHGMYYFYVKKILLGFNFSGIASLNNKDIYVFEWVNSDGSISTFSRTSSQIIHDPYFIQCGELLKDTAFTAWGVGIAVYVFILFTVFFFLGRKGALQRQSKFIGGRYLAKSIKEVNKILKKNKKLSKYKIGDLHISKDSELQNIALHGTVGSGKSNVINGFLEQVQKEKKRAFIYDKGNNFIPLFYREGKDKILSPMDKRCPNWDLWLECKDKADFESFALPLVPESKSGDPFWIISARRLFVSTAEKMRSDPERSIKKLLNNLLSISLTDLQSYVKNTDASSLVEGSIEKTAMTIRGILGAYVNALHYCEHLNNNGGEPFSIREWVHNADDDAWIFIPSDGRLHASLKPLITTWLNILMKSILSLERSRKRRIWAILDELPSLHELPVLLEFLAEARKFGGVGLIGIQNFSQLEATYGNQNARAIWDLCNTTAYFRAPSGHVSEWVQKELGEIHHKKFQDQYSYGVDTIRDGVNFSSPDTREMIVSYSDVQNLNDLECYISLLGNVPIVKVTLRYKEYPKIAEGKIERDNIGVESLSKNVKLIEDEFINNLFDKKNKPQGNNESESKTENNEGTEQNIKVSSVLLESGVGNDSSNSQHKTQDIEIDNETNILKHKNKENDLGLF